MDRILDYQITQKEEGLTVLNFLRNNGFSRHILTSMKTDKKALTLNGQRAGGHTVLKEDDHLHVQLLETASCEGIIPVSMPLSILYEDEDIIVINKAADIPVHPSIGNYTNTLANGVAAYFQQKECLCPFRCINRLDRDTSGALILAKNALSAAILSSEMRSRQIRRTYLAVVEGLTPQSGTISAPIGRKDGSVMERHIDFEHGDPAVTHYERLATVKGFSLVELHLETGRTHQIRVHMGYIGHPLPADYLYNPVYNHFARQPLHSFQLDFIHPLTRKEMCITAPVPDDLSDFFRK